MLLDVHRQHIEEILHAQNWNLDLYVKQLLKFGFNLAGGGSSYRGTRIAEEVLRNNGVLYGSTQYNYSLGGPRPMKNIAVKSKEQMIRIPCLSAPGFKEKLLKKPSAFGDTYKYGVLDVQGPDESNMFSDWDGCFSEHCMKEFRKWLKTQYPSLAALNKAITDKVPYPKVKQWYLGIYGAHYTRAADVSMPTEEDTGAVGNADTAAATC